MGEGYFWAQVNKLLQLLEIPREPREVLVKKKRKSLPVSVADFPALFLHHTSGNFLLEVSELEVSAGDLFLGRFDSVSLEGTAPQKKKK